MYITFSDFKDIFPIGGDKAKHWYFSQLNFFLPGNLEYFETQRALKGHQEGNSTPVKKFGEILP